MVEIFEKENSRTIEYCFAHLMSVDQIVEFSSWKLPTGSKSKKIDFLKGTAVPEITLKDLGKFCRQKWVAPDINMHFENLKSGALKGHSWHGTRPSTLHLSLQGKVREVCSGRLTLKQLIEIGGDITRHEYFIVAIADLCEDLVIRKFDAVPSIISKGVSDFVFGKYPFDLKNTAVSEGWTFDEAVKRKQEFAQSLIAGADVERMRKQAEKANDPWANNRFYVVSENPDIWIKSPEKTLQRLGNEIQKLGEPLNITSSGLPVLCQMVFLSE